MLSTNSLAPSDAVGPASTEFTVTPVPAMDSAIPRAMANLSGLRHAVVDHFRGNVLGRLAGDENDAAPIFLEHPR